MGRFSKVKMKTVWRILAPFCLLQLLVVLPSQGLPMGDRSAVGAGIRELFAQAWFSLDLLCVMAWLGLKSKPTGRPAFFGLAMLLAFGVILEVYDVFILRAFARMSVLYTDSLLLWDGFNLALDLVPGGLLGVVLLSVVSVSALLALIYRGLIALEPSLKTPTSRQAIVGLGVLAACMAFERHPMKRDSLVQSPFCRFADNLARSSEMRAEMEKLASEPSSISPREALAEVELGQKPDVYILVIESYGSILQDSPQLSDMFLSDMATVSEKLTEFGYRSYSNRSRSPVVGGLSWQATSTILSGIPIRNQHIYSKLSDNGAYGLPRFMDDHGYQTWTIQPGFRTRPGRPVSNPWGYQNTLYFKDLEYEGRRWGWGVVPDQYALGFALEKIGSHEGRPRLVVFTGVSTHVPWDNIPKFQDDWKVLGKPDSSTENRVGILSKVLNKLKSRQSSCVSFDCYRSAMREQWLVLVDFIEKVKSPNALFVVLGDHQPPVLPTDNADVPIHFIARGVEGLERLESLGFVNGLNPVAGRSVSHAGFFSLLAALLSTESAPLDPVYRPNGLSASGLLRD